MMNIVDDTVWNIRVYKHCGNIPSNKSNKCIRNTPPNINMDTDMYIYMCVYSMCVYIYICVCVCVCVHYYIIISMQMDYQMTTISYCHRCFKISITHWIQHCYNTVATLLQHCYNTVTTLLYHCHNTVTILSHYAICVVSHSCSHLSDVQWPRLDLQATFIKSYSMNLTVMCRLLNEVRSKEASYMSILVACLHHANHSHGRHVWTVLCDLDYNY